MPARAYANEKWLNVFFDEASLRIAQKQVYNLGASLSGFLRVEPEELSKQYDRLISRLLSSRAGKLSEADSQRLSAIISEINSQSPYLIYYTDIIAGILLSVAKGKHFDMAPVFAALPQIDRLSKEYEARFQEDSQNAGEILSRFYPPEALEARSASQKELMLRSLNSILYVKDAVMEDIAGKGAALAQELELLYGGGENAEGSERSNSQRLVDFDLERSIQTETPPYYVNTEFSVKREVLADEHGQSDIYEVYSVSWVDDLIRLEFFKSLEAGILIRKCENCGKLFAPAGRIDTIYCGSIFENTGKTCSEIGALKKYKEKTIADPAHDAFNKAYKRNNSRVRNNKMTKKEFKDWLVKAKKKRAECSEGAMSLEEFAEWLGNKKK